MEPNPSEHDAAKDPRPSAEQRLRTALTVALVGAFEFDVRQNRLEWAEGLAPLFGGVECQTLEEFFALIHPEDRPGVMEAYVSSVHDEREIEIDFRVIWPDGSLHWLHDHGQVVLGDDGHVHHIIGAITDITNHKRMEEVLRAQEQAVAESELRLRRALNVENVGVIFFDNDHRICGINDAFARMIGWSNEEVTAAGMVLWRDLTAPEWREQAYASALEFDATGRTKPVERQYMRKDGSRWWGLFSASRLSPVEGVKFVVDITERKRVEHEREQLLVSEQAARAETERAMQLREQVLAFVAHDLRNPVQTIVMATGSMLELPLAEEQRARQLEIVRRSAWRIEHLIGDLLDMSRIGGRHLRRAA